MLTTTIPLWEIVLRTFIVYAVLLTLLRVAGKRELGQMSVIDFVVVLVIANAVQNSLNGGDTSLIGGLVSAGVLIAINVFLGRYGRRIPYFQHLFHEDPTLLMQDGQLIQKHLDRERIDPEDIEMAAREHGIPDLAEVSMAILEPDGSISVIPKKGERVHRSSRRLRQFRQRP